MLFAQYMCCSPSMEVQIEETETETETDHQYNIYFVNSRDRRDVTTLATQVTKCTAVM